MKKRVTVKPSKIVLILISVLLCLAIARLLQVSFFSKVDGINLKEFAYTINTVT